MLGRFNTLKKKDEEILPKIYGIRFYHRENSSTQDYIERTGDARGLYVKSVDIGSSGTAISDFDNLYPWSNIITCNYDTVQDKVVAYLGDATFKFDGTNGQVMTIIPEFWWKRWMDGKYENIQIADKEVEGFIKSEQFMVSRYTISGSSDGVYSRSGQKPLTKTTKANFRTYARELGTNWGIMDWHWFFIQMLYLVEFASTSDTYLGSGVASPDYNTAPVISGECDVLGMKSGCVASGWLRNSVLYRGIEDIYGNVWQHIDGININAYKIYVCYDPTKYEDGVVTGDYQLVNYTMPNVTDVSIGYLGVDENNPLIALPGYSTTTSSYKNSFGGYYRSATGKRIVLMGGAYNGTIKGVWCINCASASTVSNAYTGARLIKY